ncbi:splicing factor, suppressor of white-apricot homolog isoform X2 [Hyla sarda]|uniref:splicing factor, suppressor of white-apricot homolog isoform X2 n=1 Tax=Hyla sarda TaxID=327740 RepID=UPI0024C3E14F|nr:splicing factor, suppressor of white-apricot homolog isoform X2 [Hyla sarda]XP_056389179.1 splicing factor, suppressor of white-apricot homolog isoform X2 [Hyla sarda]
MRTSRKKRENVQPLSLTDRYDGRGHLHDLSEYDAEHNSWNRNYNLSEEEARIEALCDEERYLALHTDLLEMEARQEEEYKRLSEALAEDGMYNSVGFQYKSDYYDPSQPTEEEDPQKDKDDKDSSDVEDNEEPFIAPEGLNVPSDVELPPTAKMHAIIERTANFVCKQGTQFEIMLKAKQARNSQFDFLRFDHYLNPYYKHIQKAMKEGRYISHTEKQNEAQKKSLANANNNSSDDDDDDDEDSDYLHPSLFASKRCSRLEEITKPLKVIDPDHPLAALVRKAQNEKMASQQAVNVAPAPTVETKSTTDTSVTSTYYNYYMLPDGTYCLAPPPSGVDSNAYNSLPAEDVATTSQSSISPSLNNGETNRISQEMSAPSPLAPVVAIIPPPPDIQPVIDKLAQYVARNGLKFETSVRAKNDSRFDFLQPWHQYNPYYEFKKNFFMQKEGTLISQSSTMSEANCVSLDDTVISSNTAAKDGSSVDSSDAQMDGALSKPANDGKLMKVSFAPISFAIRVKETDLLPLEKNRVKLDDDSEEEEDGVSKDGQQSKTSGCSNSSQLVHAGSSAVEEKRPQLTPEELEAKQAKQRLEDRLAAAAREKLAQAAKESKEKQLQAERKRKAALFLQTLKNPLEMEMGRMEDSTFNSEDVNTMDCDFLPEDVIVPTTEYPVTARSPIREFPRDEKEKKKKKKKKRSRSRSRSPRMHYESKSRSHSKLKHSLPTAYRTVRRSRSRSRSPRKPPQSTERRREEERERDFQCSYRVGHNPGNSRKRSRSRSPHGNGRNRHPRSESKSKQRSRSRSPSRQEAQGSVHSTSIYPVESRGFSQERYRERSQDKDGHIASEIVSSVQTKITQDLMAKVRAMLAASKNMRTGAS